jgi:hypothetical protein
VASDEWWLIRGERTVASTLAPLFEHLLSLSRHAGPISGFVSSPSDFRSKASIKRKDEAESCGTEKVQGLELDKRTGGKRRSLRAEMIESRAKVKGQGSAREPPSGKNRFFRKTYVTAKAVTYKAKGRIEERRQECLSHRGEDLCEASEIGGVLR